MIILFVVNTGTTQSNNDVIQELLRSLKVDNDEASEISPDSEVSELARLQK
ncbi:hypothetical protein [Nostoc commune]|uniref:hypothetical protein n=1 Tax=Nostoc commune TaxID=1178 RepID=UPI0018C7A781|nr:hypothetical protein [Nostoc commune]